MLRGLLVGLLGAGFVFGETRPSAIGVGSVQQTYCFARQDPISGIVTTKVCLSLDIRLALRNSQSRNLVVPNLRREHIVVMDLSGYVLSERQDREYLYDLKAAGVRLDRPPEEYFSIIGAESESEDYLGSWVIWEDFDRAWFGRDVRIRLERRAGHPEALLEELRRTWASFGDLWDGAVAPLEVVIRLAQPEAIEACPIAHP